MSRSDSPVDDLEFANEVRVTDSTSVHHGRIGEISIIDPDDAEAPYRVFFGPLDDDAGWFGASQLEKVE